MKLLLLFLIATLLFAEPSRTELQSIEPDAIVFGTGWNRVYVFVDPMCPNSRNFIEAIASNQKVQRENTYFVFLHRLNMFNSDQIIDAIYLSKDRKQALLNFMVKHLPVTIEQNEGNDFVSELRKRIENVALHSAMKRRPYLIMYPFGSKYCKVSEGEAACMLQSAK